MSKAELTKRAIAESFRTLLEVMPLEKVTVSAIAKHTGINRQTFYYHFHDIYDLVKWIYLSGIEGAMGARVTRQNWRGALIALLENLYQDHDFVSRTMHGVSGSFAHRFLQDEASALVRSVVDSEAMNYTASDEDIGLMTSFFAAGFIQTLYAWIANGMHENPERLVNRIGTMLEGTLEGSLERLSMPTV